MMDFVERSIPEFQCVIVLEGEDGRLFPLTEDCPRSVLPIANRPLLHYQLDLLLYSGAVEVFIVASKSYQICLAQCISDYQAASELGRFSSNLELVTVEEMNGSADGLRAIADRIRGDFICISADFISQYSLGELARMHRMNASDLTLLLSAMPSEQEVDGKKGGSSSTSKKSSSKADDEEHDMIGICDDGRIAIKKSHLDNDLPSVLFDKTLLHRCKSLSIRTDLIDMGVYIMSRWILEFLTTKDNISCIKLDLVPYIINRQFQNKRYTFSTFPSIQHRTRSLQIIENWSSQSVDDSTCSLNSCLSDYIAAQMKHGSIQLSNKLDGQQQQKRDGSSSSYSIRINNTSSQSLSSAAIKDIHTNDSSDGNNAIDLLKCYALLYDNDQLNALPTFSNNDGNVDKANEKTHILQRVSNLTSYMNVNRDIPMLLHNNPNIAWPSITGYQKKEQSVIGTAVVLNDKVTVKQCIVGKHSIIGARSKINACVIMDNVTIGENCTIQNTVVCAGVTIESNCNLNECYVATNVVVASGSKIKGESILSAS